MRGHHCLLSIVAHRKGAHGTARHIDRRNRIQKQLEYASGATAVLLGKPAPMFFQLAVDALGCPADNAVMIGDDAEADVGGAMAASLAGILVKTGKYRPGQEMRLTEPPALVAGNLKTAVDLLLE